MYKKKDVCIISPTYNRPEDLERMIKSVIQRGNIPGKIVLLDQSKKEKHDLTKKMVKRYQKKHSWIQYEHYDIAGTNIALNKGIEIALKGKFKLICIVADDVELVEGFLDNVLEEFNKNPKIIGLGAIQIEPPLPYNKLLFKLKQLLLRIFLLPSFERKSYRITGPYGTISTLHINKDIRDCQWLPGFVNCYKAELYDTYRIPERIGYDVIEDIDMGYYTFRKYGKGSLVIPKKIRVYHHMSLTERFPDKKRIFVNHEDHIAFYYRHFNTFTGTLRLFWEIWWIAVLNFARFYIHPTKDNYFKVCYFGQALGYCFTHANRIRKGKSRMFLNPDLSMKKEYA